MTLVTLAPIPPLMVAAETLGPSLTIVPVLLIGVVIKVIGAFVPLVNISMFPGPVIPPPIMSVAMVPFVFANRSVGVLAPVVTGVVGMLKFPETV